jgi:hypothetical protein
MKHSILIACKTCGHTMAVPTQMLESKCRNDSLFGRPIWCASCDTTGKYKLSDAKEEAHDSECTSI